MENSTGAQFRSIMRKMNQLKKMEQENRKIGKPDDGHQTKLEQVQRELTRLYLKNILNAEIDRLSR